jgi:hypothetical protein
MQFTIAVMVIVSGIASQYSPDTMRQVAVVRDWQGYPIANLPHIAVSDCADVGKVRTIRYPGHQRRLSTALATATARRNGWRKMASCWK